MRAYLLFPLLLLACTQGDGGSALQPDRFEERLATPTAQLIDVRTPAEFASGHVQGATNIDLQGAGFAAAIGQLDRGGRYVVYCRSGNRSAQAAAQLRAAGLDVVDGGGLTAMAQAGWPTAS